MTPIIGITCGTAGVPVAEGELPSYYVGVGYPRAVTVAGGTPVVLTAIPGQEVAVAERVIDLLDGLIVAGGTDIHPATYGGALDDALTQKPDRSRDRFELALVSLARERDLPTLGICRGFQMLNVSAGGTLDQHRPHTQAVLADVPSLRVEATTVTFEPGSRVAEVYGGDGAVVFCIHHQAIGRLGEGLMVGARSADGLVESLENPDRSFELGILWHPEQMLDRERDGLALAPYQALVNAAKVWSRR